MLSGNCIENYLLNSDSTRGVTGTISGFQILMQWYMDQALYNFAITILKDYIKLNRSGIGIGKVRIENDDIMTIMIKNKKRKLF